MAIGQAQVPLTFLTAVGAPWSIALAANIKLFPALVAVWWVGRRDRRALAVFAAWMAGLAVLQFVLEPQATIDFLGTLTLEQVGSVRNISPYAVSPLLWAGLVGVGGLLAAAPRADALGLGRSGGPERAGDAAASRLHAHDAPGRAREPPRRDGARLARR